jgi:hypothetical protein
MLAHLQSKLGAVPLADSQRTRDGAKLCCNRLWPLQPLRRSRSIGDELSQRLKCDSPLPTSEPILPRPHNLLQILWWPIEVCGNLAGVGEIGETSEAMLAGQLVNNLELRCQNLTQTIKRGFRDWRIQYWIDAKTHSDVKRPNAPSSATRPAGRHDGNRDAMAGRAKAQG